MIQPDEKKEPLKIYADNKESYFQAKYIPTHVTDSDGRETEYAGDVILLKNITEFKELDSAKNNLYLHHLPRTENSDLGHLNEPETS